MTQRNPSYEYTTPARHRRIVAEVALDFLKTACIEACVGAERWRRRHSAVLALQARTRAWLCRHLLGVLRKARALRCALCIQCAFRAHVARVAVTGRREARYKGQASLLAQRLERAWRTCLFRTSLLLNMKQLVAGVRQELAGRRAEASRVIHRALGRVAQRRLAQEEVQSRWELRQRRVLAVEGIQRQYRLHRGVLRLREARYRIQARSRGDLLVSCAQEGTELLTPEKTLYSGDAADIGFVLSPATPSGEEVPTPHGLLIIDDGEYIVLRAGADVDVPSEELQLRVAAALPRLLGPVFGPAARVELLLWVFELRALVT